jgi:hypothetical protein
MDNALKDQIIQVMNTYAGDALNGKSYLLQDQDGYHFTILDIGKFNKQRVAGVSLVVMLEDDFIVIERDQNEYPLVDALVEAGVPREQIILAYKGEEVPEAVP